MLHTKLIAHSRLDKRGKKPLKIRYRLLGKTKYEPLGFSIYDDEWDELTDSLKRNCQNYKVIIKKASEVVRRLEAKYNYGYIQDVNFDRVKPIKVFVDEYLEWIRLDISYTSYLSVRTSIKPFLKYANDHGTEIHEIDESWMKSFYNSMRSRGLKISTCNNYFDRFRHFLDYLAKEHKIKIEREFAADIKKPVEKKKAKVNENLEKILDAVHSLDSGVLFTNKQFKTLVKYLLSINMLGLRASDIHRIRWSDLTVMKKVKRVLDRHSDDEYENEYSVICRLSAKKTKNELAFRIPNSAYKYLMYFIQPEFQIEYIERYRHYLMKKVNGSIHSRLFKKELENYRYAYEINNNHLWRKTYDRQNEIWYYEDPDYEYKLKDMKRAVINYISAVKSKKSAIKDSYITDDIKKNLNEVGKDKFSEHINKRTTAYNNVLSKCVDKLEIENFTSHTGRHTYVDIALRNGVSIEVISQSVGHANTAVTEEYVKRFNANKLTDEIEEALEIM